MGHEEKKNIDINIKKIIYRNKCPTRNYFYFYFYIYMNMSKAHTHCFCNKAINKE